jgi:hypothetical protein
MKKIQKVISTCHECEFSHVYTHQKGSQALICGGIEINDEERSEPFLLEIAPNVKHYEVLIPENCPLETYEPKINDK